MESLLELKELCVGFNGRAVAPPIDVEIPRGIRCGIIGPNGSGKSTLVRTLLGLIPPVSGQMIWSTDVRFGYVPQNITIDPLFPLTAEDYLFMGRMGRAEKRASDKELQEIIRALNIDSLKHRLVRDLSGGERRRVLLARALEQSPDVLAFDEAWGSLDLVFKERVNQLLQSLRPKDSYTLFLIEHDLHRIAPLVDILILIGSRQVLCGPKDEVFTEEKIKEIFGQKIQEINSHATL